MPRRVLKASPDSLAGLEIGEESVKLSGSRESFFYADEKGCYIVGKMSILADPSDIRIASTYTFPTAYQAALPSTIVTPQPMLVTSSPLEGFATIAEMVADLLSELL